MKPADTAESLAAEWDALPPDQAESRLAEFKQRKAALRSVTPSATPGKAAPLPLPPTQGAAMQSPAETPHVGYAESLGRGALQGATLGFSDEIGGAIRAVPSIFQGDKEFATEYAKERDAIRANDAAAQAANPKMYDAGDLAGGLATAVVPVGGAARAAQGASRLAAAGKAAWAGTKVGAAMGAASGLGHSEAEDLGGMATDTARAGVVGGITGGVFSGAMGAATRGQIMGGASKRVTRDVNEAITGNAPATQAKKVAQSTASEIMQEPQNKAIRSALGDTEVAGERVAARLSEEGKKLAPLYAEVDKATGGVDVTQTLVALNKARAALGKTPGNRTESDAIGEMIDDVYSAWKGRGKVPTEELRKYTTNVQNAAARTMGSINETAAHELKGKLEGLVKGILDAHLDSAKGAEDAVSAIRQINRQYSGLKATEAALDAREYKGLTRRPTLGGTIKKAATNLGFVGAAGAAASGHPQVAAGMLGAGVAGAAAPVIRRAADRFMQAAVKASEAGKTWGQVVDHLMSLGASASLAEMVADKTTPKGRPGSVKARSLTDEESATMQGRQ